MRETLIKGQNNFLACGHCHLRNVFRQACLTSSMNGANLLPHLRALTAVVREFKFMVILIASDPQ